MEEIVCQLPERLLPWFAEHRRDLPWRQDREPYHIWVSEIMGGLGLLFPDAQPAGGGPDGAGEVGRPAASGL